MPTYQTGKNYVASLKAETTAGTIAAGGAGATQLRTMASPGLGSIARRFSRKRSAPTH
jgi:hypothetical protein